MGKYIHPKIKRIELDTEQAVLEVCKLGGKYFFKFTDVPLCASGTQSAGSYCNTSVKGARQNTPITMALGEAVPS
ncbi:MAG: hypothetical protein PHQ52_03425 [Candidatus Omnitrophica bacterium]|nr:hypothetical protein [Candidatus Omnitrophota bacterium]